MRSVPLVIAIMLGLAACESPSPTGTQPTKPSKLIYCADPTCSDPGGVGGGGPGSGGGGSGAPTDPASVPLQVDLFASDHMPLPGMSPLLLQASASGGRTSSYVYDWFISPCSTSDVTPYADNCARVPYILYREGVDVTTITIPVDPAWVSMNVMVFARENQAAPSRTGASRTQYIRGPSFYTLSQAGGYAPCDGVSQNYLITHPGATQTSPIVEQWSLNFCTGVITRVPQPR